MASEVAGIGVGIGANGTDVVSAVPLPTQARRILEKLRREPVTLEWRDVDYKIGLVRKVGPFRMQKKLRGSAATGLAAGAQHKHLLRGVSGAVGPGEILAIMGSSGAGKTTLLNILAGRIDVRAEDELSGTVRVNGGLRDGMWRRTAGYVEQEDLLYGAMTVQETIQFAANLKLPRTLTHGERRAVVDRVIDMLGLASCRYGRIGDTGKRGVSGGEKKRVAIAVELVTFPSLLFLDEPTTGLDATTALKLIETLRVIAQRTSMTIVLTIHQPRASILQIFTRIMFLAQGRTAYIGSLGQCLGHFERELGLVCPDRENPADFLMDSLTIRPGNEDDARRLASIHAKWAEVVTSNRDEARARADGTGSMSNSNSNFNSNSSSNSNSISIPVATDNSQTHESAATRLSWPNSRAKEFGFLLERCFLLASRDWMTLAAQFGQTIFLCLLLSFTFFQLGTDFGGVQGRLGLLFFVSISSIFTTVTPLLHVFAIDRAILMRERAGATYRVLPGYSAKFVSLAPLSLVLLVLFALPLYFIVGLTMPFDRLLVFLTILSALRIAAIGMGLMLASFCPSLQVSMIVGPLMITVFLLYGGNLANSNNITWILRWLQYISVIFYSYEALCQNEFTGNYYGVQSDTVTLVPGSFYLDLYGLDQIGIWGCFGAILGLGALFLVTGYIGLRWLTKPRITFI